jgi:hypothetical protein
VVWKGYRAGTHHLAVPLETLELVRRFFLVMEPTPIADITSLETLGILVRRTK